MDSKEGCNEAMECADCKQSPFDWIRYSPSPIDQINLEYGGKYLDSHVTVIDVN